MQLLAVCLICTGLLLRLSWPRIAGIPICNDLVSLQPLIRILRQAGFCFYRCFAIP